MASDRDHPTPHDRVAHFMATVADYERLQHTSPLPTSLNVFGHRENDAERWNVVLHALLLRKYFAPDRLALPEVARALRECVVANDYSDAQWEEIFENVDKYETSTVYGERQQTETDISTEYLYGRYLHGDYGKWAATEVEPPAISDDALWKATHARARLVTTLAALVRAGVLDGSVDLTPPRS